MNDGMTVRANRTQILYGINPIRFTDLRKRFQVVYVNDILSNFTIRFFPSIVLLLCR